MVTLCLKTELTPIYDISMSSKDYKSKADEIHLSMHLEVDGGEMMGNSASEFLPFFFLSHAIFLEQ